MFATRIAYFYGSNIVCSKKLALTHFKLSAAHQLVGFHAPLLRKLPLTFGEQYNNVDFFIRHLEPKQEQNMKLNKND